MNKRRKRTTRKKSNLSKRNLRGGRLTEEGLRFLVDNCKNVTHNVESIQTYLQNYHRDKANTFSKSDIKIYLGYMGSTLTKKREIFDIIKRKDREAAERARLGLDAVAPPKDREGSRRRDRHLGDRHPLPSRDHSSDNGDSLSILRTPSGHRHPPSDYIHSPSGHRHPPSDYIHSPSGFRHPPSDYIHSPSGFRDQFRDRDSHPPEHRSAFNYGRNTWFHGDDGTKHRIPSSHRHPFGVGDSSLDPTSFRRDQDLEREKLEEEIRLPLERIRARLAADKDRKIQEEQRRQSELAAAVAAATAVSPVPSRVHSVHSLPKEVLQFNLDRDYNPTEDRLGLYAREQEALRHKKDEGNDLSGGPTIRDDDDEYEGLSLSERRRKDVEYRQQRIERDKKKLEIEREERLRNVTEKRRRRIHDRTLELRARDNKPDYETKKRSKEALALVRARRRELEEQARRDEEERLRLQQQQQQQQQPELQPQRNRWSDVVANPSNFPFQMPQLNEGQHLLTKKNKSKARELTRKRKLELRKERLRQIRETRLAIKRRKSLQALQARKESLIKLHKETEMPPVPSTTPQTSPPSSIHQSIPTNSIQPPVVVDDIASASAPRLVSRGEQDQAPVSPVSPAPVDDTSQQESSILSPLTLSPTTTPRLSSQVVLPNRNLMSLKSKLDDREQEGDIGSQEEQEPLSPASSLSDSVNRLNSAMGKLSLGNDDEVEPAEGDAIQPPPPSPISKEYNVTIEYTPPFSSTLKRPAILRVVDTSVSIEIDGINVELSLQVLSSDLEFNIAQSFDMSTTCRDRNLSPREGVAANFAQSKCIRVTAINAPPELKPLSIPFIINFNSITECDEFKSIVDNIRTSQGGVASASEGGKRGNRKHSSRKTRRLIRRNIRRSRKHNSKRSRK